MFASYRSVRCSSHLTRNSSESVETAAAAVQWQWKRGKKWTWRRRKRKVTDTPHTHRSLMLCSSDQSSRNGGKEVIVHLHLILVLVKTVSERKKREEEEEGRKKWLQMKIKVLCALCTVHCAVNDCFLFYCRVESSRVESAASTLFHRWHKSLWWRRSGYWWEMRREMKMDQSVCATNALIISWFAGYAQETGCI